MTKFKIISVAAIAISRVAASLIIQHRSQAKLRASDALLQEQSHQMAALSAEHDRLSNLLTHASTARAYDSAKELARLRREAEALKKQTNDLALAISRESGPARRAASPESRPSAFDESTQQERIRQMGGAKQLCLAFRMYADDHQNQAPSNFDQMAPYLAHRNMPLPGANEFEIVYQGSLDKLQGIPFGSVAVVRSQQTWQGPDGKMYRIYGLADGHSQVVGSMDNFQSWEAQHVISPPAGASSQ